METFNEVWAYVQPIVTSATFGAIFTAIICGIIKGTISKKFSKLDLDDNVNKIIDASMQRIKDVTFKHDIEPLVEAHLAEIKQELTSEVNENLKLIKDVELELSILIGNLAAYFENSSAITPEKKQAVIDEIQKIQDMVKANEVEIAESVPVIEERQNKKDKKKKENTDVER